MRMSNYKEIFLAVIHNFTIGIRSAYPTETDCQLYHRLVDAIANTGHQIFEKCNDGHYVIANLNIGGEPTRVLTLYPDRCTGKLEIDLTIPVELDSDDLTEDVYMTLFKLITIGAAIATNEAMSGVASGNSELAKAIKVRAEGL